MVWKLGLKVIPKRHSKNVYNNKIINGISKMLSPLDLLLSYIACLHVFEYTIYNTKLSSHNSSSLPPWYTSSRSLLHLIGIRCIPPRFDASTTHTILLLKWRIVFEEHCKYWLFFFCPQYETMGSLQTMTIFVQYLMEWWCNVVLQTCLLSK